MHAPRCFLLLIASSSAALALPEGYIDPSNATVEVGEIQIDPRSAVVNFAVTNKSTKMAEIIAVSCTALVNNVPVETNADPVAGVAPGQRAFGSMYFSKVRGRPATASCRIEYIKID